MSRFKDSWGKAKILLSQLLCIGAVFTACTDDEVFNQTTKALQVSVSTEAPAESRAIIDGGYLPDGASIGVTLTAEDGSAYDGQAFTNLQYTAAGEGSVQTWSSATPASLSITNGKVIAYYPYYGGDDFDLKAIPVETASQTDYMYAKPVTGINMVSPAANLTMQHAMTDIRINVKKGTYTGTGEVTKITAKAPAFATSATMDVETGVFANVSGGGAQFVQELSGAAISSGNVVHDFLIVPDAKSTSGDVSIFVIIDGKKFAVTVPYNEAFQQGFTYTYNLTLDNVALTLDGVSVSKWGVKAELDESLQFVDDQYIIEVQIPSNNYRFTHNFDKYNVDIDWGDGTVVTGLSSTYQKPSHVFVKAGKYKITVSGKISALIWTDSNIITKLIYIGSDCGITSMNSAFKGQKQLSEIVPSALDGCAKVTSFEGTFYECTNLQAIPEILFDKCTEVTNFTHTFNGCESLKTIPEGLFDKCTEVTSFGNTFEGCTGLTTIPAGMFDNNTKVTSFYGTFKSKEIISYGKRIMKLNNIPKGLFDKCTKVTSFEETFWGCEYLTEIPAGLFDKCTEVTSFESTFQGCRSLTKIPTGLFDKCTEVKEFKETFEYCLNLQTIPKGLFDYNTKVTDFGEAFHECRNLQAIPTGLFDNCPEVTNFGAIFYECGSLTSIPEGLFDNNTKVTSFAVSNSFDMYSSSSIKCGVFSYCSSLTAIPEGLFDKCTEVTNFQSAFSGCTKLQAIPTGLFDNNTKVTSFYHTFSGCDKLTDIPEGLFDKCTEVTTFERTFGSCFSLQTIPEGLFDKCTKVTNFSEVFDVCSKLQTIPVKLFNSNTKVTNFSNAFRKCTSLIAIPEGLFDKCTKVTSFSGAFYECTNITNESPYTIINVDGVDTKVHLYERNNYPEYFTAPTSYSSCFYNCIRLTDYSSIPTKWITY